MEKNGGILWKPAGASKLLTTRVLTVYEKTSISPEGEEKTFISLSAPSWVIIVPTYKTETGEDYFVLVEQWRHGSEAVFVEFPGGVIDSGEQPEAAAHRELLEETGRSAKAMRFLGALSPNPAIMENKVHIFSAELDGTENDRHLDDDEFLNVITLPAKTVIKNMGTPPYAHAIMNAALFLYLRDSL